MSATLLSDREIAGVQFLVDLNYTIDTRILFNPYNVPTKKNALKFEKLPMLNHWRASGLKGFFALFGLSSRRFGGFSLGFRFGSRTGQKHSNDLTLKL